MLKKNNLYNILAVVAMVLLCLYTYTSMRFLGFEQESGSFTSIIHLVFVLFGILALILSDQGLLTGFSLFWVLWMIWLLVDFFVLGLGGEGIANIFHVLFAPMTYVFFFKAGLKSPKVEDIAHVGFVLLFALAFYLNITNLSYNEIVIGEETAITNLVYWCLCAIPFLFLVKKRWGQVLFLVLSILIVLLTGKRSASIAITLITLVFLFDSMKGKKHGFRNVLLVVMGGLLVYYIVSHYLANTFAGLIERMSNIEEDQGSGRIPLFWDVFAVLKQNMFIDWLVGRGYGSISITRHTNAHNDALQMLFEYGVIGLFSYIVMLWYATKRTLLLKRMKSVHYLGYVFSLIIFIILGAVSNLVVFYSYFAFICAYWGIVEAALVKNGHIKRYQIRF